MWGGRGVCCVRGVECVVLRVPGVDVGHCVCAGCVECYLHCVRAGWVWIVLSCVYVPDVCRVWGGCGVCCGGCGVCCVVCVWGVVVPRLIVCVDMCVYVSSSVCVRLRLSVCHCVRVCRRASCRPVSQCVFMRACVFVRARYMCVSVFMTVSVTVCGFDPQPQTASTEQTKEEGCLSTPASSPPQLL